MLKENQNVPANIKEKGKEQYQTTRQEAISGTT